MAAVVSSTLAASAWMFSATSPFVAAIWRMEADDSSALCASTSTLSAMPFSEASMSLIEAPVSATRADTVPVPSATCEPVLAMRSMTCPTRSEVALRDAAGDEAHVRERPDHEAMREPPQKRRQRDAAADEQGQDHQLDV